MPLGDKTGPAGSGPLTGRGLGYCAGYQYPGYFNPVGRGFGRGRGMGWGRGGGRGRGWGRGWSLPFWGYYPSGFNFPYLPESPTPKQEKEILEGEKEMIEEEVGVLKEQMKAIEERIKQLETKKRK